MIDIEFWNWLIPVSISITIIVCLLGEVSYGSSR